jgi:hypothetical protein
MFRYGHQPQPTAFTHLIAQFTHLIAQSSLNIVNRLERIKRIDAWDSSEAQIEQQRAEMPTWYFL